MMYRSPAEYPGEVATPRGPCGGIGKPHPTDGSSRPMTSASTPADQGRTYKLISYILWLMVFAAIASLLFRQGMARSMTPIYHDAVDHWLARAPLYYGPKEFNYLPVFVQLFRPFHQLPVPTGDIAWRLLAMAGLFAGFLGFSRLIGAGKANRNFFLLTILSLPLCVSALRNGQSSAHISACLILAAGFLFADKPTPASLLLTLALVCKPISAPMVGLALVIFPSLWWRLGLGVAAAMLIPYLFGPPDYVTSQYLSFVENIAACMTPTEGRIFADINGILRIFGPELGGAAYFVVQVAVGLLFAAFGFFFVRRIDDAIIKTLVYLALSAGYVMLLTPMNETNTYVILAPVLAFWALWHASNASRINAYITMGMMVAMAYSSEVVRLIQGAHHANEYDQSLFPLMAAVFLFMVIGQAIAGPGSRPRD